MTGQWVGGLISSQVKSKLSFRVTHIFSSKPQQKTAMPTTPQFLAATPVLASLDIARTAAFFESALGFTKIHVEQGVYGVVTRGDVSIHLWACNDKRIAEATSCRVRVTEVESLYQHCTKLGIVHPKAHLEAKPWGTVEFAILDPDGNLIAFHENSTQA